MTLDVPLASLRTWAPFKLDALGLVTLLGAEEVSNAVGALEHSRYTEYLPLFGTYLIAENKFARPIPGFALYNITDGVYIPIVNGWFSRWLIAKLTDKVTILDWGVSPEKRSPVMKELLAAVIGFFANGALIAMAALQADWYGIANAIAMIVSVAVRLTMVHENRKHLNQFVLDYSLGKSGLSFLLPDKPDNWIKVVITAPEDRLVAFHIQRGLLGCIFNDLDTVESTLKEQGRGKAHFVPPLPPQNSKFAYSDLELARQAHRAPGTVSISEKGTSEHIASLSKTASSDESSKKAQAATEESIISIFPSTKRAVHTFRYTIARAIGWLTFAIHVISIGQSTLLTQILSVGLLVGATVLTIYNVGSDDPKVGNRLSIRKNLSLASHKDAYLYLQPTKEEERVLRRYLRLPYRPVDELAMGQWNHNWWKGWDGRLGR